MRYYEIINEQIVNELSLKGTYAGISKVITHSHRKGSTIFKALRHALREQNSETREMCSIFKRMLMDKTSVSKEEAKKANRQLIDLLKISGLSLPMFIPVPLVGTTFLLTVLKLSNKYGVEHLLPKSLQHLTKL